MHGFLDQLSLSRASSLDHSLFTSRASYHALPPFLGAEMCHLVVSTTKLEAEHGLKVFAFEEDFAFQAVAEVNGIGQGCLFDDVVYTGCENESKILDSSAFITSSKWMLHTSG